MTAFEVSQALGMTVHVGNKRFSGMTSTRGAFKDALFKHVSTGWVAGLEPWATLVLEIDGKFQTFSNGELVTLNSQD